MSTLVYASVTGRQGGVTVNLLRVRIDGSNRDSYKLTMTPDFAHVNGIITTARASEWFDAMQTFRYSLQVV